MSLICPESVRTVCPVLLVSLFFLATVAVLYLLLPDPLTHPQTHTHTQTHACVRVSAMHVSARTRAHAWIPTHVQWRLCAKCTRARSSDDLHILLMPQEPWLEELYSKISRELDLAARIRSLNRKLDYAHQVCNDVCVCVLGCGCVASSLLVWVCVLVVWVCSIV